MKFERFCEYLEKLEETGSKLKMASIIASMFKEAKPVETKAIAYMSLGSIGPEFEHLTTHMAERMIITSIALASGVKREKVGKEYKKKGDVGLTAGALIKGGENQFRSYFSHKTPTLVQVYEGMRKLASISGKDSQEKKQKMLASILIAAGRRGRKYAARLAAGTMRMGVGDMTLLDGLSEAYGISGEELEEAYYKRTDIGAVAEMAAKHGIMKIKKVGISINYPVRSMLAQRVKKIEIIRKKMHGEMSVEEKYDGERIQAHKKGKTVKLFSRRLTDITNQFPDVAGYVRKLGINSAILDGEAVAYDYKKGEYLKFQKLMQRRRKYNVKEYAMRIPVRYMVFDILYDGKSLLNEKYSKRRKRLEKAVKKGREISPAGRIVTKSIDKLQKFFEDCLDRGLEGVICKNQESVYQPGARKWSWIKWKGEYAPHLADTFDLVVVGGFRGRGKTQRDVRCTPMCGYITRKRMFSRRSQK